MNHADTSAALQQAWKKKVQSAPSCFFGFFLQRPQARFACNVFLCDNCGILRTSFQLRFEKSLF